MNAINEHARSVDSAATWHSVTRFLAQEAKHLDDKNWDAWLTLYSPDAEYWIPAWDSDGTLVTDPTRHVSLIFYKNRGGLEDRVYRIRTGKSAASIPLARTCHQFQLIDVTESGGVSGCKPTGVSIRIPITRFVVISARHIMICWRKAIAG